MSGKTAGAAALVIGLLLLGYSAPGPAQEQRARQPQAAVVKHSTHTSAAVKTRPRNRRSDLMQRLSRIIEELKQQGPPAAGCMEG